MTTTIIAFLIKCVPTLIGGWAPRFFRSSMLYYMSKSVGHFQVSFQVFVDTHTRRGLGTPVFKTFPCLIPLRGGSAPALLGRRALVQLRLFVIFGKCQHQELVIIDIYIQVIIYTSSGFIIVFIGILFFIYLFIYLFFFCAYLFFYSQYC